MKRIAAIVVGLALLTGPAFADGDPQKGQTVFKKKCFACHKVGEGAKPGIGPVLNDLFGRQAGTAEGFAKFTDAMKAAGADGLVWDDDRLRDYLPAPRDYVTGTTMFFAGLAKPEDIENLIAYLKQFSTEPEPADTDGNP